MSALSFYFGNNGISVLSAKGRKVAASVEIPQTAISTSDFEDKVPADLKIIALLQEALRTNHIDAKEAVFCLSGKDLVVRTFGVPRLPREELKNAVNFEAKKYLPFKIEDLVSTFQVEPDKAGQGNLVLFMGIKKDALERYFYIASQLKLKIRSLEYSALSLLRLLKINKALTNAVTAFVYIDAEGDESHFIVTKNGFPLFSRDIATSTPVSDVLNEGIENPAEVMEKTKLEIKASLNYYHRKFSQEQIKNTLFFSGPVIREELSNYLKEMGLAPKFIDLTKPINTQNAPNSGCIKSYSTALCDVVKTKIKLDLSAIKAKKPAEAVAALDLSGVLQEITVDYRFIVLGALLCAGMYAYGLFRMQPIKQELSDLIAKRPVIAAVNTGAPYEELSLENSEYKKKIKVYSAVVKEQVYLTKLLNIIPKALPNGAWLTDFSFKKEKNNLVLKLSGRIYLSNQQKEIEAVDQFINQLQDDPKFSGYFKKVNIGTITQDQLGKQALTFFSITCEGPTGK